ncbi:MAG: hypothetical protein R3F56_01420 [Planctomycetota bacterium]
MTHVVTAPQVLLERLVAQRSAGDVAEGGNVLAAIHDSDSIAKVLGAMGLSAAVPELAPARGPPGEGASWGA